MAEVLSLLAFCSCLLRGLTRMTWRMALLDYLFALGAIGFFFALRSDGVSQVIFALAFGVLGVMIGVLSWEGKS